MHDDAQGNAHSDEGEDHILEPADLAVEVPDIGGVEVGENADSHIKGQFQPCDDAGQAPPEHKHGNGHGEHEEHRHAAPIPVRNEEGCGKKDHEDADHGQKVGEAVVPVRRER